MRCTRLLWRFGRASGIWWWLERWGAVVWLTLWLGYVLIAKDFIGQMQAGQLMLIDWLLGLPLVIALGLVMAIIWMGMVRLVSCALGKLVLVECDDPV